MASQGSSSRKSMSSSSFQGRKKANENGGGGLDGSRRSLTSSRSINEMLELSKSRNSGLGFGLMFRGLTGERTVKRLRLSKALTVPESTSIYQACCRMVAHRVDALLLTDSNTLLCGILTDKDLVSRVIARELNLEETPVSKVMTRNPVFVLSETLAVEALQKMVQARMERAAEKGKAIAAAVEGVEKNWGTSISGTNTFIETLRERIFRPAISTIIPENSKIVTVSPTETVLEVTKKMLESSSSCAVVTVDGKARGIFTSKDILMRVITQNLSPNSTLVGKVMTPNPECATIDTPIVDALHTMHDGKFLHLPVLDRDGNIVAVIDVIHITHAAVATVGSAAAANNETANTMMQKFWDSAMALSPNDDNEEARSEGSLKLASEGTEAGRSLLYPSSVYPNAVSFKIEDKRGRMHRFTCETQNLTDIITSILQRLGDDINCNNLPQILYEDEDHDKVVLASDSDLITAVEHARSAGLKSLRLHLDYSGKCGRKGSRSEGFDYVEADARASAYSTLAAGAALVAGVGVLAYLKRSGY
ncbi:hypothetical protein NC651_034107 [Populus alba x Populus x berolinensis]|nr:hypothetical protein NC651_034107 [Populus alba x Populus x berolinensis]